MVCDYVTEGGALRCSKHRAVAGAAHHKPLPQAEEERALFWLRELACRHVGASCAVRGTAVGAVRGVGDGRRAEPERRPRLQLLQLQQTGG